MKNKKQEIKEYGIKTILFQMWQRVELKLTDSRSFIGDLALNFRDTLYDREEALFWDEYERWKSKNGGDHGGE